MGKELTVPQLLLLADISERPETVSDHYRPAKALIERGYATAQGESDRIARNAVEGDTDETEFCRDWWDW